MLTNNAIDRVTFRIFCEKNGHVNPKSSFGVTIHAQKKPDGSMETMKDITKRLNADTDGAIHKVEKVFHRAA